MTKSLRALLSYHNVNILKLDFHEFVIDTPAEKCIQQLYESLFPVEHTSDIFRLLLLWRYGGFYLDSDMIVLQPVDKLGTNFACVDGENGIVANAFLNFDRRDGKRLAQIFLRNQIENYVADEWGANGPIMLTRVLSNLCQTNSTNEMLSMPNCDGFRVVRKKFCYPISANHHEKIFNETFTEELLTKISSKSVTVHIWNALTKQFKTRPSDRNFYTTLAKTYCPKVFHTIEDEF